MVQINYTLITLYPIFRCLHKFCILVNCNLKSLPNGSFFFLPTTVSLWWCPAAHLFSVSFCLSLTWTGWGAHTEMYESKGVGRRCKLIKMKTMSRRNPLLVSLSVTVLFLHPPHCLHFKLALGAYTWIEKELLTSIYTYHVYVWGQTQYFQPTLV